MTVRNGSVLFVTVLLGLTLGTGLLATARQNAIQQRIVDLPMEQASQIYIGADDDDTVAAKPVITQQYPADHPAAVHPVLRWSRIDGAVMYDVQILTRHEEEHEDGTAQNVYYEPLMPLQRTYTTGCQLALPENFTGNTFYWRVRALALDGRPVSEFSNLAQVYIDRTLPATEKPTTLSRYNKGNGTVLLYPVYDWIAIPGADHYEVEVLDDKPENPNDIAPSAHRIDSYAPRYAQQYDQKSRMADRPFYWRVRAVDSTGGPIGVYSDAQPYLTDPAANYGVAIFGDSISHGGGSISYSPTDWEFSYGSYLYFPTVNLSQSGDTSAMSSERFERDVVPFHPKYVLILMGSNSLREGVPAVNVIADMKSVKAKCQENGIHPVFLTVPPVNPDNIKKAFDQDTVWNWQSQFDQVNSYIRSQVHIDITSDMADENGELRTDLALDGLHMDPPGKKMMADAINAAWPEITALPDSAWEE